MYRYKMTKRNPLHTHTHIKIQFSVSVAHLKGGEALFGLVQMIISSRKMSNKNLFDYVVLIINY